ncbi:Citramalyl-CoA lyase, mitochondrial, partial [Geodia barretti]
VIHPAQVPVVQEAFSPSEERVGGPLVSFLPSTHSGQGAFVYEGHMTDRYYCRPRTLLVSMATSLTNLQTSNSYHILCAEKR